MTDQQSRLLARTLCGVVPVLMGLWAAFGFQQDANWDLRNYHWYNAYAFLTDRYAADVLPAHIPTFYNPLMDVPFFWLAQVVPARTAAFVLGTVQGLNFILLYAIAGAVLSVGTEPGRRLVALELATIGLLGGGHLGLLGTTFYDNVLSLFVLGGLALVVRQGQHRLGVLLLAGLSVGFATGLKLPTAVFAVGLCAALLVARAAWFDKLTRAFSFGVGVLLGLAVSAGQWMWFLWTTYHNPIFPYFNGFFRSPLGVSESYRDTRFVPESVLEWLAFPIVTAVDPMQAGEIVFRDFRIAAAFVVLLATAVLWLRGKTQARISDGARYVIAAAVITYLVWLVLFAIYRYIIPLEMLAPMVVALAVAAWPLSATRRAVISGTIMVTLLVTTWPGNWGRIPFGAKFIETVAPEISRPDQTLVLMLSTAPTAWVIPAFPPQASFVRVQGYGVNPEDGDTGLNIMITQRIAQHQGDVYTLAGPKDHALAQSLLARYGLVMNPETCRAVIANLNPDVELCAAQRVPSP